MSNFKVEFVLKQHTPIIHFQGEQAGATLRATELKPKFDRFLIEYAFNNDKEHYKEYLIDKDKKALNYKVNILSSNENQQEFEKYPPLYFGKKDKKKLTSEKLTIAFISLNSKLLKDIKENFEAFLANTNFGTRQSKGYGGYYIQGKNFNPSLISSDRTKVYSFTSSVQSWEKDIKLFYAFLRAGINEVDFKTKQSKFYAKSLMFLYASFLGITWEKKAIKEHFINHKQPQNYYLMKDLLGLSTSESWGFKDRGERLGLSIKKYSKTISRYKSPITFKPIQEGSLVQIYFFADKVDERFLDQHFKIEGKGKPLEIKTPNKFDIDDFFKQSFSINLASHIDAKFHGHQSFKKLQKIFNTLKAQV